MQWTVLRSLALAVLASAVHGAPNKASADLAIQAGYHVLYSYPGLTPPDHLFDLARAGKLGGIILFGENVNSSSDVKAIAKQFQDAYAQSPGSSSTKPPLLIVTDQEGGEVRRLAGGPVLSAKKVGASADPKQAATEAGTEAAEALTAAGVNGNLAPVVDVYRVAGDFDDRYQRSFSNNASIVAECGAAWVIAQQNASLPAAAKHFPGLGAASTYENTDDLPVNITLTLDELRRVDEAPYRSVIAAGIDMVMPSWALYPALDSERPSGLSKKWIQGELRQRLGFEGVIISDAIEAGGLNAFGSNQGYRAVLASEAGMDIIVAAARNATQGEVIVDSLVAALQNGTLDRAQFDEATQRIIKLRSKLPF